ncbi:MAG: peptidylprolyl isomerase [Desulfuromonadales bacterium]|nr:peptidylprolyl isomerase [Desulfuromonadales bacterium]
MIRAAQGDTVKVHYVGRLADGTEFDTSRPQRPMAFILGRNEVIAGFDEAVTGMYQGETRLFTVAPEKAYGSHDARYVEELDRALLPPEIDLQVGRQIEITNQKGDRLLVLVTALTDSTVTLDGNHPLAGKELIFEIELLEVDKPSPEQTMSLFPPPRSEEKSN